MEEGDDDQTSVGGGDDIPTNEALTINHNNKKSKNDENNQNKYEDNDKEKKKNYDFSTKMKPSSLRQPNFNFSSMASKDKPMIVMGQKNNVTSSSLMNFVKYRHENLLHGTIDAYSSHGSDDDDNDDDNSIDNDENDDNPKQKSKTTDKESNETKKEEYNMEKCVALLEPHLAAFRERCGGSSGDDDFCGNSNDDDDNKENHAARQEQKRRRRDSQKIAGMVVEDEVPPQLLRVARFFRWRWVPIKRAILRSFPSSFQDENNNECKTIEVGAVYRIRLAHALQKRGLLTKSEIDELQSSFLQYSIKDEDGDENMDNDDDEIGDCGGLARKRKRRNKDGSIDGTGRSYSYREEIKSVLSDLPMKLSNPDKSSKSVKHLHRILAEYCARLRMKRQQQLEEYQPDEIKQGNMDSKHEDPRIEEVADWILTSFAGVILGNGINCRDAEKQSRVELSLTSILLDSSFSASKESTPDDSSTPQLKEITSAIQKRIKDLLSPPLIDALSGVHILTLARIFSCINLLHEDGTTQFDITEVGFIVESIIACAKKGGGAGLSTLPKLIATYLSLVCNNTNGGEENSLAGEDSNTQEIVKGKKKLRKDITVSAFERRVRRGIEQSIAKSLKETQAKLKSFKDNQDDSSISSISAKGTKRLESCNAKQRNLIENHNCLDLWDLALQSTIHLLSSSA